MEEAADLVVTNAAATGANGNIAQFFQGHAGDAEIDRIAEYMPRQLGLPALAVVATIAQHLIRFRCAVSGIDVIDKLDLRVTLFCLLSDHVQPVKRLRVDLRDLIAAMIAQDMVDPCHPLRIIRIAALIDDIDPFVGVDVED